MNNNTEKTNIKCYAVMVKKKKGSQKRKGFAGHFCVMGSHVFFIFQFFCNKHLLFVE